MKSAFARLSTNRLFLLSLVAVLARAITFGNPIVNVDEEFYYSVGHAMAHGALPYVDIWDRKPFGLFLLYLPPGMFDPPVGIYVYQALAFAAVVGTAAIIARIADRVGWQRGATIAAALYILWLDLADGQGGQAPVFYNLFMAGAAWLIVVSTDCDTMRRRRLNMIAMGLVGCALQIKYSVVFEGLAFGLWPLWDEWRRRRSIAALVPYAIALVGAALLPTAIIAGGYWIAGHADAFLYANFLSIIARRSDPITESLGNLLVGAAILAPLLLLATVGPGSAPMDGRAKHGIGFLRLWLMASVFGFLIFGSWFNHYTLPVMLPAAACAAGFLASRRYGRATGWSLLALIFLAGQFVMHGERRTRGSRAEFAALVRAIGPGPGALYVYQGSAMLYPMTGRPALTRYIFPTHLMLLREHGAVGTDQAAEIDRIFDRHPAIVVLQSPEDGEDVTKRAIATRRLVSDGYRRYARLPLGNKVFDLCRRSGD
ncbi:hypothetical protein ASG11_18070 [Sphingomonas sp. Leaf357]|uniref:DUF2029 domain-containing protein n=1 Tax=Sphingomonas sp. Leaf357 TaxID=1736350 RepID=UPI0006F470D6|nr:DUF2029 domain-containing protein [Sphingomonas sp. Leaf357]KQS01556.1 hypothetical protein ASG11_18070 [Sphingomonas sp. Leaf357]